MISIERHPRDAGALAELLKTRAVCVSGAEAALKTASAVLVYGSCAAGLDGPGSDLDVLAVGPFRARFRTAELDLTVIPAKTIQQDWWLATELAGHLARWGIVLRGKPGWLDHCRISSWTVRKKRQHLYGQLVRLYLRKEITPARQFERSLSRITLDLYRLAELLDGQFISPSAMLIERALNDSLRTAIDLHGLLGRPAHEMVTEIAASQGCDQLPEMFASTLAGPWENQLRANEAWRARGRP